MRSSSGRYVLLFNGEVYNHRDLRRELGNAGSDFRGHSDSEVVLAAFERWGIEPAVRRFVGMFAMAVWDARKKEISLVRDRLGIKPLFYGMQRGTLLFGSELKALLAHPEFEATLDPDAVASYLRHLYVPAPRTILEDVYKLRPGHMLTVSRPLGGTPDSNEYWSVGEAADRGSREAFAGTPDDAVDRLESLLRESVRMRMQADVPVGAWLSGGIDSSAIVAMMQEESARPVRTFTIDFDHEEHSEASHAREVSEILGTEHSELTVSGSDARAVIPRLPFIYDEPLANPSQIPTILVSELARRDVKVALSGDGGDELFAGYNRYVYGRRLFGSLARIPRVVRRVAAPALRTLSPDAWDRAYSGVASMTSGNGRSERLVGEKVYKASRLLGAESEREMYRSLMSSWQQPRDVLVRGEEPPSAIDETFSERTSAALLDRMQLADQKQYLPDDLLAKVDRASMSCGLEVRVPLLDHRIVEFAWRLPETVRIRDGQSKWPLRQLLYRRIPRSYFDRPKTGFTVPVASWLRGPLKGWADDLLSPRTLRDDSLLDADRVREAWERFRAGKRSDQALGLWAILTLQAWRSHWSLL